MRNMIGLALVLVGAMIVDSSVIAAVILAGIGTMMLRGGEKCSK